MVNNLQRNRGNTVVGALIGLVLGLVVAVLVAVFVTKVPKQSDRLLEPKSAADAPDPNKSLYGKGRGPSDVSGANPDAGGGESKDSILGLLGSLGQENLPATQTPPAPPSVKPKEPKPDTPKTENTRPDPVRNEPPKTAEAAEKPADSTRYLLQAGAFRERDDADSMKGKLALLGFEAKVSSVERDGNTIFRVRTGPYKQLEDVNSARRRMADGGVETSLVPLR
jgi:cell division septation protein DedD